MLIGPVFTRELITAPRRTRFFLSRAVYVAALLVLISTAWGLFTGTQDVRNVGDTARFGAAIFQIIAILQLTLGLFFSALLAAGAVAQEKDRRTLVLLLLTHLSNSELVLGKLLASLLSVITLIAATVPLFMLVGLFGGISHEQIGRVFVVTLASVFAAGSLGSTVALWREKTFLSLALTTLVLFFWLATWGAIGLGALGQSWGGVPVHTWAASFSPLNAVLEAARPSLPGENTLPIFRSPVYAFLLVAAVLTVGLNVLAIARVRVWNPTREARPRLTEPEDMLAAGMTAASSGSDRPARPSVHAAPGQTRPVWENPVLWREICTWAYGRKIALVRLAYLVLFAAAAYVVYNTAQAIGEVRSDSLQAAALRSRLALTLAPLFVLSLVLLNALAVNAITNERDLGALDLLLVTDLSPYEFVFGKLGGIFFVSKEIVLLPLLLCIYLALAGVLSGENLFYLVGGLLVLDAFVAMLGIHVGMAYANSRTAVAVSLGTVFFLFVGVATCMRIMVSFSGSFQMQLMPFMAAVAGGSLGLYVALGVRNPSSAIALASIACPVGTFVAITSFLRGETLGVFGVATLAYGFATATMLIPALYEFDVATGRTTVAEE